MAGLGGRASCRRGRSRRARYERGHYGEAREREDYAPGVRANVTSHRQSFLARGRVEAETTWCRSGNVSGGLLHSLGVKVKELP